MGNIAELKTGQGKTLTSVLPAYLNALSGNGVHVFAVIFFFSSRRRHTRCLVLEFRRVLFRSRWGKMPLNFLVGQDIRHYRYGLIGLEDWSMSPVIQPGAIVLIDQNRRRITQGGWTSQHN